MKTIDPENLTTRDLAHLLNLAEPGTVTRAQVQYHQSRATFPLGKGTKIHLVRYAAWLLRLLKEGRVLKAKDGRTQAQIMRERRAGARDIGTVPAVVNPKRRAKYERNLVGFCLEYLPDMFPLPFSEDHLTVIRKAEAAILEGGLFAEAVYRGFGKTTLAEAEAIWATIYGHRKFVPIISADKAAAIDSLDSIGFELSENDRLLEDFPEVCFPIRELQGIAHRCAGQTCCGKRTFIEWKTNVIVLPAVPDSKAGGGIIKAYGLTGRIRGMKHKRADGTVARPDFVIIEDPQTDASAKSPSQCETREGLITGAVLGLAGHTSKLSAIMPCTIIRKGDMADRLLDHTLHPEWQGEVLPMLREWSKTHDTLWLKDYANIRRADPDTVEGGRDEIIRKCNAFYAKHRKAMDRGAKVSWEHCKEPDELSAIQHAYNLYIDRGEKVFMAEYQNAPIDEYEGTEPPLMAADFYRKLSGRKRYRCEFNATTVVGFIDVRAPALHWVVCAFGDGFTGDVIDYGVRHIQKRRRGGLEAAISGALDFVVTALVRRAYPVDRGGVLRMSMLLVDSGWKTKTIYAFCRKQTHAGIIFPSKGQGGELTLRPPRRLSRRKYGLGWHHALTKDKAARLAMYDVDQFKSFVEQRIRTPMGGSGCLTIFGADKQHHRAFVDHCTAERPNEKQKKTGDVFQKWELLPGRANHWWDGLVGCHLAATMLGVALEEEKILNRSVRGGARKSVKLSELQK